MLALLLVLRLGLLAKPPVVFLEDCLAGLHRPVVQVLVRLVAGCFPPSALLWGRLLPLDRLRLALSQTLLVLQEALHRQRLQALLALLHLPLEARLDLHLDLFHQLAVLRLPQLQCWVAC